MYSIEEALKEQIKYCHELPHYHCGIYIKRFEDRKPIFDKIIKLIANNDSIERMFNNSCSAEVRFKNGSFIRMIRASENARGYKNHGAIIDSEIESEIVNCIIMPALVPRWFEEFKRESWEEVKKRTFYCNLLEVDMEDLPLICDCGCKETEQRNVYKEDINGIFTEVEWQEYCKGCGRYLGSYSYGHWEY